MYLMNIYHEIKKTGHWFGWLERKLRHLPRPRLFIVEGEQGSYYSAPDENSYFPNGAISLNEKDMRCGSFSSVLAHEYRHHWQSFNCGLFPNDYKKFGHLYERVTYENYWYAVKDYVRQPIEFEHSCIPSNISEYQLAIASGRAFLSKDEYGYY